MLLSPNDILRYGLLFVGYPCARVQKMSEDNQVDCFRAHYGSPPAVLANMWSDLCQTEIPEARLDEKEKTEKGLKRFMIAHYYLWTYPKNVFLLSSRFGERKRSFEGEDLWMWPRKIAALKELKIVWDDRFNEASREIFSFSLDGVDILSTETKNQSMNKDTQMASHKYKRPAYRWEVLMAVHEPKILWINGPFKAGKNERVILRTKGLKDKLKSIPEKLTIADAGYQTSEPDEKGLFAVSSSLDSSELAKFKSRVRSRHESWNGRAKFFSILGEKFKHGTEKQKVAFEAVAVIVQYQMDLGAPIFSAT